MATRTEALASAAWQARQHASEVDALSPVQWSACLLRAWRRLWTVHPEAFHVGGVLVGSLPDLPTTAGDTLPIVPEWVDVLAAAAAGDAVGGIVAETPERFRALNDLAVKLYETFARGLA